MKNSFLANLLAILGMANPYQLFDRYKAYLVALGKQFSASVQKSFGHVVYYYNAAAASKTNVTLFGPSSTYSSSTSNLSSALLGVDQSQLISAIRMFNGANASLTATDWTPGVNNAELQNGKFDLIVNNVTVLSAIPLTVFNSDGNPEYPGTLVLEQPVAWGPQEPLQINVTFDVAPATANQNIRFELHGDGTF
jgi:sorbitol-specific phosphotransferase system component IIA